MQRLLKNGIYLAVIVAIIFAASQTYEGGGLGISPGSEVDGNDAENRIVEILSAWSEYAIRPDQKIAGIAAYINGKYPEATGAGAYLRQGGVNFVRYDVNLGLDLAPTPQGDIANEDLYNQIIGELAFYTVKATSVRTGDSDEDSLNLGRMEIFVCAIDVEKFSLEELAGILEGSKQAGGETVPGGFYRPRGVFLDAKCEALVYIFNEENIKKFAVDKEAVPGDWRRFE